MAFRFRLQSVLKLREAAQTDRQQELAQILQVEQILKQQKAELEQRIIDTEEELRQSQVQSVNVDTLMALRRYIGDTRLGLRQLEAQQDEVNKEIERRQLKLAQANQEVKIMEKLKENQQLEFQAEQLAEEQTALDEFRPRNKR